ncbi:MAG TPA: hypothetical protein VMY37_30015 [Thermoguttaceae bacterium]|nr:hypothetical protein [Thermoguttaceae bacterium]
MKTPFQALHAQLPRFATLAVCLAALTAAGETPDDRLIAIRDGFAARRDAMLHRQVTSTYPPLTPGADDQLFSWHKLDFALSALYLDAQRPEANRAVLDVVARGTEQRIVEGEERFHWVAPLLIRIHELFGAKSNYFPGRLTPEAEEGIRRVLWEYASEKCEQEFYTPERVWWFWGSENHDAQRVQSLWGAAKILSASDSHGDRIYRDGHTAPQHYQALNEFVKERFRQRIAKGLLAETASPGYGKYTLACWYNYFDFGDPPLRKLADAALAVWWADWAQEQIDTVRGGAKARVYQGESARTARGDASASMAWYYLGVGPPRNAHPGIMCMATSGYRLPPVVMDIALDAPGRGTYEYRSRRPGLLRAGDEARLARQDGMNVLDPECGGLVRYTYATPDFIIGSWMLARRPHADWAGISSQNRWQGVIFAGSDPDARIFPQCEGLRNGKTYNQYWSVQNRGTMIVCKLPGPAFSKQAGDMRVFFASSLKRQERDGWIFAEAERALAAVRILGDGQTYTWDDENWARSRDSTYPVIIEAAGSHAHPSFAAFQDAVLARQCEIGDGRLTYQGPGDSGTFTFDFSGERLPEINGAAIDLSPSKTFDSPFLQEDYAAGRVTIAKGSRRLILDVSGGE